MRTAKYHFVWLCMVSIYDTNNRYRIILQYKKSIVWKLSICALYLAILRIHFEKEGSNYFSTPYTVATLGLSINVCNLCVYFKV